MPAMPSEEWAQYQLHVVYVSCDICMWWSAARLVPSRIFQNKSGCMGISLLVRMPAGKASHHLLLWLVLSRVHLVGDEKSQSQEGQQNSLCCNCMYTLESMHILHNKWYGHQHKLPCSRSLLQHNMWNKCQHNSSTLFGSIVTLWCYGGRVCGFHAN
jgi:hypothetical protein